MPVFRYSAATSSGRQTRGAIDADSKSHAARKLRKKGLYPIEVVREKTKSQRSENGISFERITRLFSGVGKDVVAGAVRQLATLLNAGMPLDNALSAMISKEGGNAIDHILRQILDRIREGGDLAGAFAEHPGAFSSTFVTMVRAGENSGSLGLIMDRMADHMEEQLALSRKVRSTLAYPIVMAVVGIITVIFLLVFVIPKVTQIFTDLQRALPLPTRILIATSEFLQNYWIFLVLGGVGVVFGLRHYCKTAAGKAVLDKAILRLPVFGDLIGRMLVSRFARTLGMLLANGVTLVKSLEIVRSGAGNTVLEKVVKDIAIDVQEGKPLAERMGTSGLFSHTMVQMVAAGEQSGQLEKMLFVVADECDNAVNARLQVVTSLMEPLMILFLGGVVGFVVIAIILPIFEMSNLVG